MMGNGMMNGNNVMIGWGGMYLGPWMMIGVFALIVFSIVMIVRWTN